MCQWGCCWGCCPCCIPPGGGALPCWCPHPPPPSAPCQGPPLMMCSFPFTALSTEGRSPVFFTPLACDLRRLLDTVHALLPFLLHLSTTSSGSGTASQFLFSVLRFRLTSALSRESCSRRSGDHGVIAHAFRIETMLCPRKTYSDVIKPTYRCLSRALGRICRNLRTLPQKMPASVRVE